MFLIYSISSSNSIINIYFKSLFYIYSINSFLSPLSVFKFDNFLYSNYKHDFNITNPNENTSYIIQSISYSKSL